MTGLCGLLGLLLMNLFVSSAEDKETIEVFYKQREMTLARGSSVKLSCEAQYDFKLCDVVHVVWCHQKGDFSVELTDPRKYRTTVNETITGVLRVRQVVTEILELTLEDSGQFQCKASCADKDSAMGHFITITVQD